jgi:transposase
VRLAVAFFCAALGFTVQWREQWLPASPAPERIAWEHDRSWFHNMKNLWTENIRADCEWWGKFFAFTTVVLAIT